MALSTLKVTPIKTMESGITLLPRIRKGNTKERWM